MQKHEHEHVAERSMPRPAARRRRGTSAAPREGYAQLERAGAASAGEGDARGSGRWKAEVVADVHVHQEGRTGVGGSASRLEKRRAGKKGKRGRQARTRKGRRRTRSAQEGGTAPTGRAGEAEWGCPVKARARWCRAGGGTRARWRCPTRRLNMRRPSSPASRRHGGAPRPLPSSSRAQQ